MVSALDVTPGALGRRHGFPPACQIGGAGYRHGGAEAAAYEQIHPEDVNLLYPYNLTHPASGVLNLVWHLTGEPVEIVSD